MSPALLIEKIDIRSLDHVGPKIAEKLEKIGIINVQDLLFHLPSRYEDRTRIWPIGELKPGQHASIKGEITHNEVVLGKRAMLVVKIKDETGSLSARFFNFNAAMKASLKPGQVIQAYGELKRGKFSLEIIHPEFSLTHGQEKKPANAYLTPVYPSTDGLRQLTFRHLSDQALTLLDKNPISELLPDNLYPDQMSLKAALVYLHRPPPDANLQALLQGQHPAQKRLILEELLAQQLSMLALKAKAQLESAFSIKKSTKLVPKFLKTLPFSPTGAQKRVGQEIAADLQKNTPMMRLVQGDVGAGKTLVAAIAALQAIEQGYQVALMAPTELLAEQHAINFEHWLAPLGIKVGWLFGKRTTKAKEAQLKQLADGETQMLIGTHAIFQKSVVFNKLALVIIDEQHRFGVQQRLLLREKGIKQGVHPHQLIMTATPIPRTLAMTVYADLNTSIIDELPPGRTPIHTVAIPDTRRIEVIERVEAACLEDKRQAYWVCTLIEDSEALEAQAAEETAADLTRALPKLSIGLVHGRMKPSEKQTIMQAFKNGELDLLVATTVIEVGVDVPNASLMIIENPERLGLAQLHQLRGRVGRGKTASHCVLLYKTPLSKTAAKRLQVLRESNDGFLIAKHDLDIRGPGEVLGTKQTGMVDFKVADLIRDQALIPQVQQLALKLHLEYPDKAKAIINRWLLHKNKYSKA